MQTSAGADFVSISRSIGEKLTQISPSPSECCIFRLHKQLRGVNEKAYEPETVAIGPYHHGNDSLQMMEKHKLRYLQLLLKRKNESADKYITAIISLEQQARRCYAEPISLGPNEMIEMMVLDGCFIIELMRKFEMAWLRDKNDYIFQMDWIVSSLQRDLMLFENQLPFFILCTLFDIIEVPNHKRFIYLALHFFHGLFPGPGYNECIDGKSSVEIGHLLGLIHDIGLPSFAGIVPNGDGSNKKDIGLPSNKKDIGLPSFAGIVPNRDGSNKKDIGLPSNKKDIGLPSFAGIVPNGDGSNKKDIGLPSNKKDIGLPSFAGIVPNRDGSNKKDIGLISNKKDIGLPSFAGIVPNRDGSNKKDIGLLSNKKDIGLPSFAGIVPNGDGSNKKDIGLPSNKKDIGLPSFAGIVPNGDGSNKKDIGLPSNKKDIGLPSFTGIVPNEDGSNKKDIGLPSFAEIVPNGDGSFKKGNWCFIPNTIELREAGVKLVKIEGASLFDIKFKNGVMKIPPLTIEDRTESFFRNLIAYEQYCPNNQLTCITGYVRFMDCLIDSPKDVEILSRCGIIDNWLGDNEVVSTIFNKISDAVTVPSSHFQYADIFNWVNIHCSKRRNRWMAMLKRNYLNSPWAFISILAALVLLLLTFTQTVFTVFPRK